MSFLHDLFHNPDETRGVDPTLNGRVDPDAVTTPGYWDDRSAGRGIDSDLEPSDPWAPTEDQTLPNRGVAEHGVPFDSSTVGTNDDDDVWRQKELLSRYTPRDLETLSPIPVVITGDTTPLSREIRFATQGWSLATSPQLVLQTKPTRRRVLLSVGGAGLLYIGSSAELLSVGQGFLVQQFDTLELFTTEAIWAMSSTTNTLSVLDEYTVDVD